MNKPIASIDGRPATIIDQFSPKFVRFVARSAAEGVTLETASWAELAPWIARARRELAMASD
ncbi:MAG: hypothetical protein H7X93_14685, partial [Sphingomonadaceae bacterium]|nr:hypothetical protein [Sphingomonadaceae bacterium]